MQPDDKKQPSLLSGLLYAACLVFGVLIFSRVHTPEQDDRETVSPRDSTTNKNQNISVNPSRITNAIPTPKNSDNADGGKHNAPFWEKLAVLVTLGLLTVNIFQMRATQKSADAAKRANEITQHVFEANIGDFGVANLSRQSVGWSVKNNGKTTAEKVRWTAKLTVTNLANGTVVQSQSLSSAPFNIKEGDPPYFSQFPLSDIVGRNFESESFKVEVSITYGNGFGREVSQSFCREIIGGKSTAASLGYNVYECFEASPYRKKRIEELRASKPTT